MPRLFAGLEIPADVAAELARVRQPLTGAKWVEPSDMHVTLRFFGDVETRVERDLIDALSTIDQPMFQMRITGVGVFGSREPHALWAGVGASRELEVLQAATERAARIVGLKPETRSFRPHVTLARLRTPPETALARLLTRHGGLALAEFPVVRFALFSAKPHVGGGPYVVEQVFALQGGQWDDDDDPNWPE